LNNLPNLEKLPPYKPYPYDLLLLADETVTAINKYIELCEIYLIKMRGQTIGVCALQTIDEQTVEIKNLAIIAEKRGAGVGSWCIAEVEKMHPEKLIQAGTGDGSKQALTFYKKNGFSPLFVRPDFFVNHYPHPIIENGVQLKDQIVMGKISAYKGASVNP
jgi:aminoglycoside 6'-N-acetyltransferase I